MPLNAEQIINARDLQTKEISVPEWGGNILIGAPGALDSARLRDWLDSLPENSEQNQEDREQDDRISVVTTDSPEGQAEYLDDQEKENQEEGPPDKEKKISNIHFTEMIVKYLQICILDPDTLMPAFTEDQIEQLGRKSGRVLGRIYDELMDFLHETPESADGFEKNSGRIPAKGSGGD